MPSTGCDHHSDGDPEISNVLISSATEQTTAATDLIIAVLAIIAMAYLKRAGPRGLRGKLWRGVFLLLAVGAMLGAIGHGIVLGEQAYAIVWSMVYLPLSLLVGTFVAATLRDMAGDTVARRVIPILLVVALGFFGFALRSPDNFLPFIVYEIVAMTLSLAGFIWITIMGGLPGATWITASIAINILAAVIQAEGSAGFTLIWQFDHNGVFHLVQMIAIAFLVYGLRIGSSDHFVNEPSI